MPIISEVDPEKNVLIRKVVGELTVKDFKEAVESTPRISGFKDGMGVVWDFSEATRDNFSKENTLEVIRIVKQWHQINYRVAAYAPRDLDFGLARLYDAHLEIEGVPLEFSVFRDMDSAIRWVNGEETD